ncbi:Ubiquitin thioesterase Zranb1 [Galemys pyrenaicus]|uniref:Ubiquitin thioesterase Zranb1 n=1 Tax=Galemys pyrenaicus TaxID=202257 RepID=A0A8J6DQX9_GALPY|nr:Ubiquitin thioesterase Zranb1 [Galemys pyrenaicus]
MVLSVREWLISCVCGPGRARALKKRERVTGHSGFQFYTRWKDWESWYSQSFGLHFSLREEQWQEDWAFILSLASQVLPVMHLRGLAQPQSPASADARAGAELSGPGQQVMIVTRLPTRVSLVHSFT